MIHTIFNNPFLWRDAAEIIFFAAIIYYFSLWLRKDRQKNLLGYFYSYIILILASHHAQLSTMHTVLLICAPIACVLFIIAHQEILQRNLVALRNIVPAHRNDQTGDWLEALMRSFLVAASNNKELSCIIENYDSLEQFILTEQQLNIPIKKNVLDLVFESTVFDATRMVWTNSHGTILAVNAELITADNNNWLQQAVFITAKTDAIIFNVCPTTRNFTIIASGQIYNNITALHALSTIKKYLQGNLKGESNYAQPTKKTTQQQSTR